MNRIALPPLTAILLLLCCCYPSGARAIEPGEVFPVWPGNPPGPARQRGPEKRVEGRPRPFYQITDVSKPTVSVFLPPKERRSGAAVLVLPGGGLQRLAIEHEGLEVAEWLNALNVTVFVLKYRVPERAQVALQDAQRALSLIRARAGEWGVDPDDVGVVGFSAGAELAAWLATHHQERQYEALDASDTFSCRPAYAALIYPGGLTQGGPLQIKDPIASRINGETPPMFVAQAYDDSSENSLAIVAAMKRARMPAELHIYQEGGHGFGVRTTGAPVGGWKDRWRDWLAWQGFLDAAPVRALAREIVTATNGSVSRLADRFPQATVADAYDIQKRVVRARVKTKDRIIGYRADVKTGTIKSNQGAEVPLTGVVFRSDQLKAADTPVIERPAGVKMQLAPGLAYVISVDFSFQIANDTQAQGAFTAVAPVVELPVTMAPSTRAQSPLEAVAGNLGSGRFLMGAAKALPEAKTDGTVKISVRRTGATGENTVVPAAVSIPWPELRQLLNQITGEGYTVHAGDLIIIPTPAAAVTSAAEPGKYEADFGDLGIVGFEIR